MLRGGRVTPDAGAAGSRCASQQASGGRSRGRRKTRSRETESSTHGTVQDPDDSSILDVKCESDDAWYDATISVEKQGSNPPHILVKYVGFEQEDEVLRGGPMRILQRLRPNSKQLQADECGEVHPGEVVCAFRKNEAQGTAAFFDAEVRDVRRRHVAAGECMCAFLVRWTHGEARGGEEWVSSADVCRINVGDASRRALVDQYLAAWDELS